MYDIEGYIESNQKLHKWKEFLNSVRGEIRVIQNVLNRKYNSKDIIPDINDLFKPFELTDPEDVKVVIFGQDPYKTYRNNKPIATGIAFSVDSDKLPPTLMNIYDEIDREFDCDIKENKRRKGIPLGSLDNWCKQGVLLLNSSMTISKNEKVGDHKIWLGFFFKLVEYINEINEETIYMLWGNASMSLEDELKITSTIFKSYHPSPMSTYFRKEKDIKPFLGSNQFIECNNKLIELGLTPIEWCE